MTTLTNASVKLVANDGNAFSVLGRVRAAILKSDKPELVDSFMEEAIREYFKIAPKRVDND